MTPIPPRTQNIKPRTAARWALCLLLALLVVRAAPAQTIEVIPPTGKWVTDRGEMLSDREEASLAQKLNAYEDSTSTQIVIVTLPDLGGAAASDYAVELGRAWGVGQQGQDNGVVILVSRDDREVFIATGYGLEGAIPDAVASRIVRNVIVPSFRAGRFYEGLSAAVDYLVQAAQGEFTAEQIEEPERRGGRAFNGATVFVLIIIAYFFIHAIRTARKDDDDDQDGGRRVRRRRHGVGPIIFWGGLGGHHHGGGGFGGFGGGGFGGGGFGGFGGGGGGFGGGGAGGSW